MNRAFLVATGILASRLAGFVRLARVRLLLRPAVGRSRRVQRCLPDVELPPEPPRRGCALGILHPCLRLAGRPGRAERGQPSRRRRGRAVGVGRVGVGTGWSPRGAAPHLAARARILRRQAGHDDCHRPRPFPGAGLFVLSAWCLGVLNSHHRFLLSYAAPVLWNAAMIATLLGFGADRPTLRDWPSCSRGDRSSGAALQVAVQMVAVRRVAPELRII